jgi:hypothetical protein
MKQIICFVREVPEKEADKIRKEAHLGHTEFSFYPYRDLLSRYGFFGGEVIYTEDDELIVHTMINIDSSICLPSDWAK